MSARFFNCNKERNPSEIWTPETARQARLFLTQARHHRLRRQLSVEDSKIFVCAELIDSGHLDGWVTLGADGKPHRITSIQITASGREYLESFEDEMVYPNSLFSKQALWLLKGVAAAV